MVFLTNEKEVYDELVQNAKSFGVTGSSTQDLFRKLAQQKRRKTTTVAHLKTYLHTLKRD